MPPSWSSGGRYLAADYRFWFELIVRHGRLRTLASKIRGVSSRPRLQCVVVACAFALIPWVTGLLAALLSGNAVLYVSTPGFYLGLFGVAFVMWALTRGIERLCDDLRQLEDVAVAQPTYFTEVHATLTNGASRMSTAVWIAVVGTGLVGLIFWTITGWDAFVPRDVLNPYQRKDGINVFPHGWRAEDARPVVAGICLIWVIWCAAVFGTALELLLRNILFVRRLRGIDFVAFPALVRLRLHPFVHTYLFASLTWTMGVGLFVLLFVGGWSTGRVIGLGLLLLVGILTFVVPYAAIRTILDRSHEAMSQQLARTVVRHQWQPDFALDPRVITSVNTAIAADAPPVISRRGALAYIVFQLVIVVSVVEKEVVQRFLHLGSS